MSELEPAAAGPGRVASGMQNFNLAEFLGSPGVRQLAALFGVAVAVAVGVTVFMWSQKPGMQTLYAGLSDRDSAEVVEALRQAEIPFKQDAGTGAVQVAAEQLHEARMKLAGQGLPRSAGGGFEMIREEQGIGVSQFLEQARYQHALETELARTISQLQSVRNARVHLAIPKRSAFARNQQSATASVLVALYPGRRLEGGQVDAIVHLVASSIPHLLASAVSVVDESGRLLSRHDENGLGLSANQLNYRSQLEQNYRSRIEQLLLPVMGPGHISVQVSVDLDFSQVEETRESYAPDKTALRSEQFSENREVEQAASGVPGALSNRVPGEAGGNAAAQPASSRQGTRNFEIDRTVSHTRSQPGRIRRISAAVLIDDLPVAAGEDASADAAVDQAQLAKIEALVKDAMGFEASRGDTVSVQSISFVTPEIVDALDVPLWEQPLAREIGRQLLGALLLLIVAFLVLRPALKSALKPPLQVSTLPPTPLGGRVETVGEVAEAAAPMPPVAGLDSKLKVARDAAKEDPKRVAQLMKQWVGDD